MNYVGSEKSDRWNKNLGLSEGSNLSRKSTFIEIQTYTMAHS